MHTQEQGPPSALAEIFNPFLLLTAIAKTLEGVVVGIVHNFDHWSGRALPSPGEGDRGERGGQGLRW